ncbi:MAG: ABC transporter substrate-binding protein, partial [Hyphomonas sp.]|nr:ABC transporter substrate-binding protein [Hyphomonas sp.]
MKRFSALTRLARAATGVLLAATLPLSINAASANDQVRIGVDFNVLGSQVWVAQEQAFFETHGIDADIRPFAFGVDTIDATLTGQLDFGIGLDFATTTRLQTEQLKIITAVIEPEAG